MSVDTDELRRLYKAATPHGPYFNWKITETSFSDMNGIIIGRTVFERDTALIVAAVNALPALLDALDASAATIADRDKEIERLRVDAQTADRLLNEGLDAEGRWHDERDRLQADNARLTADNDALRERCAQYKEALHAAVTVIADTDNLCPIEDSGAEIANCPCDNNDCGPDRGYCWMDYLTRGTQQQEGAGHE